MIHTVLTITGENTQFHDIFMIKKWGNIWDKYFCHRSVIVVSMDLKAENIPGTEHCTWKHSRWSSKPLKWVVKTSEMVIGHLTSETVSLNTFQHFPAKEIMAAKPGLIVFIKRAVHQSLPTIACLCLNTILLAVVSSQRIWKQQGRATVARRKCVISTETLAWRENTQQNNGWV